MMRLKDKDGFPLTEEEWLDIGLDQALTDDDFCESLLGEGWQDLTKEELQSQILKELRKTLARLQMGPEE